MNIYARIRNLRTYMIVPYRKRPRLRRPKSTLGIRLTLIVKKLKVVLTKQAWE